MRPAFALSLVLHATALAGVGWFFARARVAPEERPPFDASIVRDGPELAPGEPQLLPNELEPPEEPFLPDLPQGEAPAESPPTRPVVAFSDPPSVRAWTSRIPCREEPEAAPVAPSGPAPAPAQALPATRAPPAARAPRAPIRIAAAPVLSENRSPAYPARAVRLGWEGTVLLEVVVTVSGEVRRARVLESSGHLVLDEAALQAVVSWRFRPATSDGVPFESKVEIPVVFRLE
ncbi:MAG: energy transducer TonB [Planctomycetes bacterium]|nr:energy transducer TonB [Planctomycetota bacterium]